MGYTKKETDFWGNEKEVHYDDNNKKVGETKYRETFFGNKVQDHYNTDGEKVGETRKEEGLFSDRAAHYDREGNRTGYTKDDSTLFGDKIQRHHDIDGKQVGKSHYEDRLFSGKRKVHKGEYFKGSTSGDTSASYSSSYTPTSEGNGSGVAVGLLVIIGVLIALWFGFQTNTESTHKTQTPKVPQESETAHEEPTPIFTMRVTGVTGVTGVQELNVRNGPGPSFLTESKVYNNDIVQVYETKNGWYHIGIGWVNSKFLSHVNQESSNTEKARGQGIPKLFQGKWTTPQGCVSNSDSITEITDYNLSGWEWGCELKSVIQSNQENFSGIFLCGGEGEHDTQKITLMLQDGKLISNGDFSNAARRCNL